MSFNLTKMSKIYKPSLKSIPYAINFPNQTVTQYKIKRYPPTKNNTLQAHNTADQFLVDFILQNQLNTKTTFIYNDSFGYLATHLFSLKSHWVVNLKSQAQAIQNNLNYNKIEFKDKQFIYPLQKKDICIEVGMIKIPKSMDLFELYLQHLCSHIDENSIVVCGFMTRHFTKQMITIAEKYFDNIAQSKAWKKSRLLILKGLKKHETSQSLIHHIHSSSGVIQQYYGVFSAKNIDYATQFLIQNIAVEQSVTTVLDLASGNGILAKVVHQEVPHAQIYLLDDSYLAVESSKLNLKGENIYFHHQNNLDLFDNNYFDYIISNPPFHVEHEIDISIPLSLFEQAHRCLTQNGILQLVANQHLNYKSHLSKLFSIVHITAQNDKFVVYSCQK